MRESPNLSRVEIRGGLETLMTTLSSCTLYQNSVSDTGLQKSVYIYKNWVGEGELYSSMDSIKYARDLGK